MGLRSPVTQITDDSLRYLVKSKYLAATVFVYRVTPPVLAPRYFYKLSINFINFLFKISINFLFL